MNVLGMGPMELMLIVVLALIVFGPAKLPEIMGQIGRAIGDFRRATSELSDEFNRTIQTELQETREIIEETRGVMMETKTAVQEAHLAVGEAQREVSTLPAPARVVAAPAVTEANGTDAALAPIANGVDSAAAANGLDVDPAAGMLNGTEPVMADTTQWSWETAAPPEPPPPPADAELPAPVTAEIPDIDSAPPSERKVARGEDLQPPY
jgi:TatA/E family protein of Tat protein translocase